MAARLSIIVPTPDGDGLHALFESLYDQLGPNDEVLVVGDTHDGPLPFVQALIESIGPQFRYLEHDAGHHCWGHCQINYGITQALGEYLVFIDDDDTFTPDALRMIRARASDQSEPRPLMFKFYAGRLGRVLPERYEVVESAIGGHCLVTPNIPGCLGQWGERYGGDFDWIVSTLALWPAGPAWYDDVIASAR
jgi:glycosyltransferase involved in cell wall biosynthesis